MNWRYLGYVCIGFAAIEGYHIEENGNWIPMIISGLLGAAFLEIADAKKKRKSLPS